MIEEDEEAVVGCSTASAYLETFGWLRVSPNGTDRIMGEARDLDTVVLGAGLELGLEFTIGFLADEVREEEAGGGLVFSFLSFSCFSLPFFLL